MDQPFRPPGGGDFIANPFAGFSPQSSRETHPEPSKAGPSSRFDITALLGGPADIAAMQRELDVRSGPLNLDTPAVPSDLAAEFDAVPVPGRLPTGDEMAQLIALALDHITNHVADRSAFCQRLGDTIAEFLASGDSVDLGGGGV